MKQISDSPTEEENRETIIEFYRLERDEKLVKNKMMERPTQTSMESKREKVEVPLKGVKKVEKIIFVCEAGMGSSAMGAAMLRKKLSQVNLAVDVGNSSIDEIPYDADLVICHQKLLSTVQKAVPTKACYPLKSFTDMKGYDELVKQLKFG